MDVGVRQSIREQAGKGAAAGWPLGPGLVAMVRDIVPQFSRYTVASVAALTIDFAIYLSFIAGGTKASVAGAIGYLGGLVLHYALSTWFVFETAGSTKSPTRRFIEFILSGLVGLTLTAGIISLATELLAFDPLSAKVVAVGVSFVAVFLLRRSVVFASSYAA